MNGRQGVGQRPARVRVDADHHVVADCLAHGREIFHVLAPAAAVRHLQAQHADAEFVHRALRLRNHRGDVVRHAHRPFERDARLAASTDQVVERCLQRFSHRVTHCDVEDGARGRVAGEPQVESLVDRLEVEDRFAEKRRAVDLLDRGDHALGGVRDEVARTDRPDLAETHHAVRVDFHQYRLAEQALRRTGIVGAARKYALQPLRERGHENFNAIDHGTLRVYPRKLSQPLPAMKSGVQPIRVDPPDPHLLRLATIRQ